MLFEIVREKQVLMGTDYVSCIYDKETLSSMSKAGYKFKLKGRIASADAVNKFVKENEAICKD